MYIWFLFYEGEMVKLLEKVVVKNLYWIHIIKIFNLLKIEADFFWVILWNVGQQNSASLF